MTDKSVEYQYQAPGFTNPSVEKGLVPLLIDIVRGFGDLGRLCDLGCGNGSLAVELGKHVSRVVGVDSSSSGINVARNNSVPDGRVTFICAEIANDLPELLLETGGPFDALISVDVIEHLYRPQSLIEVAWRALKPGGHLIVCTPYHGYLKNLAISLFGRWDAHHGVDWDGGHIKFFSIRTLANAVRQGGFHVDGFRYFGRAPYLWKNMICIASKQERVGA